MFKNNKEEKLKAFNSVIQKSWLQSMDLMIPMIMTKSLLVLTMFKRIIL